MPSPAKPAPATDSGRSDFFDVRCLLGGSGDSAWRFGGRSEVSMAERMIGVRVSITRYVSDEPQPGIVECAFCDVHGRRWSFVEKTAMVSSDYLDARTSYPQPGIIACEIAGRRLDATGREIILVSTERP